MKYVSINSKYQEIEQATRKIFVSLHHLVKQVFLPSPTRNLLALTTSVWSQTKKWPVLGIPPRAHSLASKTTYSMWYSKSTALSWLKACLLWCKHHSITKVSTSSNVNFGIISIQSNYTTVHQGIWTKTSLIIGANMLQINNVIYCSICCPFLCHKHKPHIIFSMKVSHYSIAPKFQHLLFWKNETSKSVTETNKMVSLSFSRQ